MMNRLAFRIFLLSILCILTETSFSEALESSSLVPLRIQNPGMDIPKVGSSAFDKLFFNTKSARYEVPYPIGRLVDEIVGRSSQTKPNKDYYPGAFHAYFPFSRSLQRPVDLSYDPLLSPRMVFSLANSENPLADNKFFWAYVKARDQLEVISYNEEAGRFEFQIIKNYSKEPEVYYAPRAKCMTCHQGQAPILAVNSWEDAALTNGNHMGLAFLRAHSFPNNVDPKKVNERLIGSNKSNESIGSLDFSVRSAEHMANFQRIYVHACETRKCRLELILRGLIDRNRCSSVQIFPMECESLEKIIASSSLGKEQYATSQLSDGDGEFSNILKSLIPESPLLDFDTSFVATERFANSNSAKLKLIESLKNLSREDNPATSRLRYIVDPYYFSSFDALVPDLRREFIKMIMPNKYFDEAFIVDVQKAVIKLYQDGSSIFDKKALSLLQLEQEVQMTMGLKKHSANSLYRRNLDIHPYAKLYTENTLGIFVNPVLNKLATNCGACHQNSEGYPNPFLVGSEDQVEANVQNLKDKMLFRIENRIMPPTEELQNKFLNSEDREKIIRYLKGLGAN